MTPEQIEAEQSFNEQMDRLFRFLYVVLFFALRHVKRRWKVVLPTIALWAICYGAFRLFPGLSWHIPAAIVLASILVNVIIGTRDEYGQIYIHPFLVEDGLKACGFMDSPRNRRPKLLRHQVLPGGDIELIMNSAITEDTWLKPQIEERFCGTLGTRNFRRVFRDSKNQIHLILASGQLKPPVVDVRKLVELTHRRNGIPLGEGFAGIEVWDYIAMPHLLVTGITGSGKSSLIRIIMALLAVKGFKLYLIDPKAALDYQPLVPYLSGTARDAESGLPIIEQAWEIHSKRLDILLEAGFTSLAEAHRHNALLSEPLIVLVVDEFMVFASDAKDKGTKESATRCLSLLQRLSAASRATGVFLLLSTQHGTVEALGGSSSLKQQLHRLTGRLEDETASKTILGVPGAEQIPANEKGHFVFRDGEELKHFMAYHVDNLDELLSYASPNHQGTSSSNNGQGGD